MFRRAGSDARVGYSTRSSKLNQIVRRPAVLIVGASNRGWVRNGERERERRKVQRQKTKDKRQKGETRRVVNRSQDAINWRCHFEVWDLYIISVISPSLVQHHRTRDAPSPPPM